MPFTDKECPTCGATVHTDSLLEKQCLNCGDEYPDEMYEGVEDFYTPEEVDL